MRAWQMYRCMLLREKQGVNLQEWVHYWALHRGDPPKSVFQEVNERLRQLVLHDAQALWGVRCLTSKKHVVRGGCLKSKVPGWDPGADLCPTKGVSGPQLS